MLDQHADDEAPALGVIVGSCPGRGVCVHDTIWNSPADEAGLRQGDYILSVNGQSVSSPGELKQVVQQLKAGEQATAAGSGSPGRLAKRRRGGRQRHDAGRPAS